jgi:hypothetical protein
VAAAVRIASTIFRNAGLRGLATRAVRVLGQRLDVGSWDFPLLAGDIADSTRMQLAPPPPPVARRPLHIGWITVPPSSGSGGHTTMFRMVQALESAGHHCTILLYDRFGGDERRHAAVIRRSWPWVSADVADVAGGIPPVDVAVATGWQTAHVLASRPHAPCLRFYLVQDYEPYFYARGSEFALAEDSYRFGFETIAIGRMVADLLRSEMGVTAHVAEFGCDTDVYRLTNHGARAGVVFYIKPDVPRRGARLGILALEEFHRRHPEQPIRVFGDVPRDLPFAHESQGKLTPEELNDLYNLSVAGLAMSFTNISLVAEEMLAAGTTPVINDSPLARIDLPNAEARWARATPGAIADALCEIVEAPDVPAQARAAAAGVRAEKWRPAQGTVVAAIERAAYP